MNYQETELEIEIRGIYEKQNPYSLSNNSRNLWSEGFREGVKLTQKWNEMEFGGLEPKNGETVLVKTYTGQIEVDTFIKDGNSRIFFKKEAVLPNYTVRYWRKLF